MDQKPWVVRRSRSLLDASPRLKVWVDDVTLPDGRQIDNYYQLWQPDYAVILPVVDIADENPICLTLRRYKHGVRRVNVGLPAGSLESGESAEAAARRELLEETGCTARRWMALGNHAVDGNRGLGRAYLFLALGVEKVQEPVVDDLEEIQIEFTRLLDLEKALLDGEVATLGAAAGIAVGVLVLKSIKSHKEMTAIE